MQPIFAERMNNMKSSRIRELLKLTEQPDIISFAGGLPAPEHFPVQAITEISINILKSSGAQALQYATTEGYLPLREFITKLIERSGIKAVPDDILITSGSQQGLSLSGELFLNPGDVVICEKPTYLGALNAFNAYQPKYAEINMDEEGMIIEEVEKALAENPKAKFIYTVPDFQNPTGRTISLKRRKKLVKLAAQYHVPIIEDNPYGALRFMGENQPAIKHFDEEGWVIYLGTLSKIFCPGLRIGWICAAPEILREYNILKQGADLHSNTLGQMEAAEFMLNYDIEAHIAKIKETYLKRRQLMLDTMKAEFPASCKFTKPEGGLFTWVELPEGTDATEVLALALKEKVAFVPGEDFFANEPSRNYMRLNYSNASEENIITGVKRLAKVLKSL